ncbi:MAG TPA: YicC/YloC family endoribonuclease [Gemmatimonadales bacterium]
MPKSMTGFGVADGPLAGGRIHVEIRTVNHRHFNVQMRLVTALQPAEETLRRTLRERIERGHVSLSARWVEDPERGTDVGVDVDRARAVLGAVTRLKAEFDLPGDVDVEFVARQPDVLLYQTDRADTSVPLDGFLAVVQQALDGVSAMRTREGVVLGAELLMRLDAIATLLDAVRARAPHRVSAERDRLRSAVRTLLDGTELDEQRLAQEIAIMADRLDITEEIVRLDAHIQAARETLSADAAAGRALGFLAQEMLREVNTIGSKANDSEIARAVITMKGELDKMREQLENLE